jgi:hypothetical protein
MRAPAVPTVSILRSVFSTPFSYIAQNRLQGKEFE